ncbi:MAG: hypothetical protein J1F35_07410 [Erysipelotrichales bacterium]|nr:hypothetical protein [Erysipelotrichales bacterium]
MKKETFQKKYPLFHPYFPKVDVRVNMAGNEELYRKYQAYNELIASFIKEIDCRFDNETIKNIIIEGIVKLPDEMMVSLITAYLNSSEVSKNNANFIAFYNKTSNLGIESVKYMETNGIITNRSYIDIPNKVVDAKYAELKTGEESFKGEKLVDIYETLIYPKRKLVVSLLESGIFDKFDEIFAELNYGLTAILDILFIYQIDARILSDKVYRVLGAQYVMLLVCLIVDNDAAIGAVEQVKKICVKGKFELLRQIILDNLLLPLSTVNYDDLADKETNEVIEILKKQELVLKMN